MGSKNRVWFCDHYTLAKFRESMEMALLRVGSR
jgi:hypothetical protein